MRPPNKMWPSCRKIRIIAVWKITGEWGQYGERRISWAIVSRIECYLGYSTAAPHEANLCYEDLAYTIWEKTETLVSASEEHTCLAYMYSFLLQPRRDFMTVLKINQAFMLCLEKTAHPGLSTEFSYREALHL